MFFAVDAFLQRESETYRKACEILDYKTSSDHYRRDLPAFDEFPDVIAQPVPGGNEGIYIDLMLKYQHGGPVIRIGTFKTLDEGMAAYAACGQITGLLVYGSNVFLSYNWQNFAN